MFRKIMAPVDLAHARHLEGAIAVAADLAKSNAADLILVGVTAATPGSVAHTPKEFAAKLDEFAAAKGDEHGVAASGHSVVSHDPAVDLDDALLAAADEIGADLIVMGTHIPGLADHFWASHGGTVASRASASVFLVRG